MRTENYIPDLIHYLRNIGFSYYQSTQLKQHISVTPSYDFSLSVTNIRELGHSVISSCIFEQFH